MTNIVQLSTPTVDEALAAALRDWISSQGDTRIIIAAQKLMEGHLLRGLVRTGVFRLGSAIMIEFRKQCDCDGGASCGRIIAQVKDMGDRYQITTVLHGGPVCDVCNTPWKRITQEETGGKSAEGEAARD